MATSPLGGASAPVTLPGTIPPMPAVARILSRYDRDKLAAFVSVAIDLLDVLDGDAEPEYPTVPDYGLNQDSPPQQPDLAADRANMRPHLERIRRSRCDRTRWGYVLREVDSEPGESA